MWRTHPPASRCSDDCWAILVFLEPTLNPIFGVCKMLHVLRIGSRKNCRKTPSEVGKSMVVWRNCHGHPDHDFIPTGYNLPKRSFMIFPTCCHLIFHTKKRRTLLRQISLNQMWTPYVWHWHFTIPSTVGASTGLGDVKLSISWGTIWQRHFSVPKKIDDRHVFPGFYI